MLNFIAMKPSKKAGIIVILVALCVVIKVYSLQSTRVETGYSAQFFPLIGAFLRKIFGGLPISMGDILYGCLLIAFVWEMVRLISKLVRHGVKPVFASGSRRFAYTFICWLCSIYIVFNLFWGINYNREGIAWQLGLATLQYSPEELKEMNCLLLLKVNASKAAIINEGKGYPTTSNMFTGVEESFKKVAIKYPFLSYKNGSLKRSMWGWLGNYAGFTGYYNPFTGEAQVNTNVPKFLQPFTSCHEVAHPLGYAKEMDANFVGYLAASASPDPIFKYSVYLDLFTYANRNLFMTDSVSAKQIRKELYPEVKADLKEWYLFTKNHQSFVEPVVRWGYGIFLKNNGQPQGMLSYDQVTGFLIAYYKKYGTL